jgi:very-short-patch-repair endonuclease
VTCNDLSSSCLRRRLLEFFENTKPQEIAGINREELERRAFQDNRAVVKHPMPFESWFEVDVALELARRGFNVVPQYEIAGKRIDLVIEGGNARLAVECDGDKWHGADRYEEDMQRQRQLERCSWEFIRIRESAFYSNREQALQGLWQALEERGIFPGGSQPDGEAESDEDDNDWVERDYNEVEDENKGRAPDSPEENNNGDSDGHSTKRAEEVAMAEIQDAILQALLRCPNQSCTIHSMTARVLKELGILTRGYPRIQFERRVMHCIGILESRERIEKYKAKNRRVRLIRESA